MTPQPSQGATPGVASQSLDGIGQKQIGAFTAPQPATPNQGKPTTDHVSLDLGSGGTTEKSKPVPIPKVEWKPPVTAVQAKTNTPGERMVVTYVGDGDSVSAKRADGSSINCRIDSIDAPEVSHPKVGKSSQPYGEEAKKTLQTLIANKEVTIKVSRPATTGKNHDRALCQIEIEGVNIDKTMVKEGMAWLYRRYNNDAELSRLENEARAGKRGLWSDPNPVNPETFRRMQQYGAK